MEDTKFYTIAEAGEEIDKKIQEFMKMYSEVDYSKAYVEVLKRNPELAEAYTKGEVSKKAYSEAEKRVDQFSASKEVARLIETEMLTFNISYIDAMKRVLNNPEHEEIVKVYMSD